MPQKLAQLENYIPKPNFLFASKKNKIKKYSNIYNKMPFVISFQHLIIIIYKTN